MTTYKARKRTDGDYGNTPQAAALRLQLAGLAALERTDTYQEMCAAADVRVRAESALPRQQNGKLLARALAAPSSAAGPPPASGGGTGTAREPVGSGKSPVAPGRSASEAGA